MDGLVCTLFSPMHELFFVPNLSTAILPPNFDNRCDSTIRRTIIWEDIYCQKPLIVQSRLLSMVGKSIRINARETRIINLNKTKLNAFLEFNHLNIPTKTKYKYGLEKDEVMVAAISFGKACPIHRNGEIYRSHELIRYCSALNHTVVGGLSKLIQHFVRQQNPEDIMTYVDKEWSTGNSYLKLGFELKGELKPRSFWVISEKSQRFYKEDEARLHASSDDVVQTVNNCGSLKFVKIYK